MTDAIAATVARLAASYPPEAAHTPRHDRIRDLTAIQHFAWVERFEPGTATLAEIEGLHAGEMTR